MRWVRSLGLAFALVACGAVPALVPAPAAAAITGVFAGHTVSGTAVACTIQADGVRVCQGDSSSAGVPDTRLKSFDGTALALYVILPKAPAAAKLTDGNYPLVVQSHGWGGQAGGPNDTQYLGPTADQWARQGYAVLQLTARGFGDSCGTAASRAADRAGCQKGYIRLDDDRFEVRDIQYAVGLLVDAGIVNPNQIGVTGESYGGGVSLQLATLRDRVMTSSGALIPWTSPKGTPLHVAAAAPMIPWSDLVYSLMPNGGTLDNQIATPTADLSPIGVEKQSLVSALYAEGSATGYYAPAGTNPSADLTTWFADLNKGEPYDGNKQDETIVKTIAHYHSAYYLLDGAYGTASEPPAPLLIANGFTDDLFPVDEALRYYNLEQSLYPSDPISLFDFDGGHPRGQNKPAELTLLANRVAAFFNHYVKGTGAAPSAGVTALTQTCPASAPAGGPYSAPTWAALHPGQVSYSSAPAQTIASGAGDPSISAAIDPIGGKGACATVSSADQGAGVATYRLPPATGTGYTLLGSPALTANIAITGSDPMIAERLWDVDPSSGTQTLVARGVYRPSGSGAVTFQLHPGAWHFAAGHIAKLELLSNDSPYVRTSNGKFSISVSDLSLQLPVHETPGAKGAAGGIHKPTGVREPTGAAGPVTRPGGCIAHPTSRITKRRVHASRRGVTASGTAGEKTCPGAVIAVVRRERVKRILVSVYRTYRRGRCRFLRANGKLSRKRRCSRPLTFRAKGTAHWKFHLGMRHHHRIARGRYWLKVDAVDGFGRHQRRSPASLTRIRVR